MSHTVLQLENISLSFSHKTCFEDFSVQVPYGARIAIIGRNGSGKSSLLKILYDHFIVNVNIGYVPQTIEDFDCKSGGQRFNAVLTQALSASPDMLLLDEPTNHLDASNKKSLLRMLQKYAGTLIVVSHDTALLRTCVDTFWHIDDGKITEFSGYYDDFQREVSAKRTAVIQALERLERKKKETHQALMQEQSRAAKSRTKGEKSIAQCKWPTVVSNAKAMRGEETSGRKRADIKAEKAMLMEELSHLRSPEVIVPKFSLTSADVGNKVLVSICDGWVGYVVDMPVLSHIDLSLRAGDRIAITGDNGSGKSTLIKAILSDPVVFKSLDWHMPKVSDIGYLDQHYATLVPNVSVVETIQNLVPGWTHIQLRRHLTDFLFCKNEEVNALVSTLSGGEKVRLTLAQIAAKTPKLLILDEVTNNLDLETREYVVQVLQGYPGAMMVISHDEDFLREIEVREVYLVQEGRFTLA